MLKVVDNSSDLASWLSQWRTDLLRSSSSDPLIHLDLQAKKCIEISPTSDKSFCLPLSDSLKKLIKEQQNYLRSSGIHVLCLVKEVLLWKENNRIFVTPLFLIPCSAEIDKINQTVQIQASDESVVNPFLEKTFADKFDKNLVDWIEKNEFPDAWEHQSVCLIGNFHYHRHVLLKDYDDYDELAKFSKTPLENFLFERQAPWLESQRRSSRYIFPMDTQQQVAFDAINAGNHVLVEGPPGSGKSQVLANLLFSAASNKKIVALCSEKRTALQVIEAKLKQRGLDLFCHHLTDDSKEATNFIRELEKTWNFLEEKATSNSNFKESVDYFLEQKRALELKLERLSSFPKLRCQLKKPDFELSYYSDWDVYVSYKEMLVELSKSYYASRNESMNFAGFFHLKLLVYQDIHKTQFFARNINFYDQLLKKLQRSCPFLNLTTQSDILSLDRVLLHAQILSQDLFHRNPDLFIDDSKKYKKFRKNLQQYLKAKQALELLRNKEVFKWKNRWSEQELLAAKYSFENDNSWKIRYNRWKSKFVQSYKPEVFSKNLAIQAISHCLDELELASRVNLCLVEFHKDGIFYPEVDIPVVLQLQRQVNQNLEGLRKTMNRYGPKELDLLLKNETELKDLQQFVSQFFKFSCDLDMASLFERILLEKDFILGQREKIAQIVEREPRIFEILPQIQDLNCLDEVMLYGAISMFEKYNPELFHYKANDLALELDKLISEEDKHFETEVQRFYKNRIQQFIDFHQTISEDPKKQNIVEKDWRSRLKSGRSLLLKEFKKSKQHKSIRELMSSDAALWVQLLKPMMLFNPLMISKTLPNKANSIDLLLFDEASQIPFSHVVPSIFRAKQIAVFGDSNQLNPSNFFVIGERMRSSLLTESKHILPMCQLVFHYRSRHESLIAFSNRFFYNNQLTVLPAANNDHLDGVFCHYVQAAVYDGVNSKEASALVLFLEAQMEVLKENEKIGIVAFSERQVSEIELYLQNSKNPKLQQSIQNDAIIGVSLEKIQGDEFDILFISLGYGRDINGDFALRFGPLNQEGGEKRLNVLFSRARRAIHLFHSIKSKDFGPSENLGVQMLKNFLLMHENRIFSRYKNEENLTKIHEVIDPFYNKEAVTSLMILKRHAALSGLLVKIKFWKDV